MRTLPTTDPIRADFDRIADLPSSWDVNAHYHQRLLRHVPVPCRRALDVGCGTGAFTAALATRADEVVGIDLSPRMIDRARRLGMPNVAFEVADVRTFALPDGHYDCIVSIATLHHLDLASALERCARALRDGGALIVLDLVGSRGVTGLALSALALPVAAGLRLAHTGRLRSPPAVRAAWSEHGAHDALPTWPEVRSAWRRILPAARLRRHLLWRYSGVYVRPVARASR